MANQAYSEAADLMVGAGVLYFKRKDDPHGFHHLGNAEEFNLTTDVTTVEKNSSMNRRRELMASVVTAVNPSASITLNEYNPYNLALGLFGEEHVHKQASQKITGQSIVVNSVPGIVELADADGNRYYNIKNVVLRPSEATPSSYALEGEVKGTGASSITVSGTYGGASNVDIWFSVTKDVDAPGDVAGLEITYKEGLTGAEKKISVIATGTTTSQQIGDTGLSFEITVEADQGDFATIVAAATMYKIACTASSQAFKSGVDYQYDAQEARAGFIKIPANSSIKEGDTVLVNADIPEADFVTVSGASAGEIEGELLFIGDPNQGDIYTIEAWDCKINPEGDLTGLISEDFGSFELTVKILADYTNHPEYPFYKATRVGSGTGTDIATGTYDPLQ